MIACDTLGSYGSTKRYKSVDRLRKVNERCVIGAGGEFSDFQHIHKMLDELATQDFCEEDDATTHMTPKQVGRGDTLFFSELTRFYLKFCLCHSFVS